jgi:hypothetical protein
MRVRTCFALVVALVFAAMSSAAAAPRPRPAVRPASLPLHLVTRQQFLARLPFDNVITSIEATSRSDAWAVGGIDVAYRTFPVYALHWNGKRWSMVRLPDPKFVPVSVRASNRHDVWIFGTTHGAGTAEALRWDGARWHVMTVPQQASLSRPVVLGPSDVWLSGPVTWTRGAGWRTATWHWNGRSWTAYALPVFSDWGNDNFIIAGSSDRNLWAAGTLGSGSRLHHAGLLAAYRWNGRAWHRMAVQREYLSGYPQVAVSASGEVWIAGYLASPRHDRQPVVLYRTGSRWSRLPDRLLDTTVVSVIDPIPDGLNGIWFEWGLYWSGRAGFATILPPRACRGAYSASPAWSFMTGIPGTRSVLTGGSCQPPQLRHYQGEISITGPR